MTGLVQKRRRLGLLLATVVLAAFGVVVLNGQVARSAATIPPVPLDPAAAESFSSTTTIGGTVSLAAKLSDGPFLDAGGNAVDPLGGHYLCGELGCIDYGMGWSVPGTVVTGCGFRDLTCTYVYRPDVGGSWAEATATHGGPGVIKKTAFWVYAAPVLSTVTVRAVDTQGNPVGGTTNDYFSVVAVRDGFDPHLSECLPSGWYRSQYGQAEPSGDPCVILQTTTNIGQQEYASSVLPIGTGWTIYAFPYPSFSYFLNPPDPTPRQMLARSFATVHVNPDDVTLDVNVVRGGVDSTIPTTTTTSSTTTSTEPSTTTTTVVVVPEPPVVTAAAAGRPGTVSGTVTGQPGASVTVAVASSTASSCPKLMSGASIATVGSTTVVVGQSGTANFTVDGPVPAGSYVYGTSTVASVTSSVGECFVVPSSSSTSTSSTSTSSTSTSSTSTSTSSTSTSSSTSTTRPSSSTSTSSSTTSTVPSPGSTRSTTAAPVGVTRIEVLTNAGFTIGGYVQIGTGPSAEVRHIVGFGSLIFDARLQRPHPSGESVRAVVAPAGDRSGPVVVVRSPDDGQQFRVGETATLRFQCSDRGVGVEVCGDRISDGSRLDTSSPGARSVTITAWDRNGNVSTSTISYRVVASGPRRSDDCDGRGHGNDDRRGSRGRPGDRCR